MFLYAVCLLFAFYLQFSSNSQLPYGQCSNAFCLGFDSAGKTVDCWKNRTCQALLYVKRKSNGVEYSAFLTDLGKGQKSWLAVGLSKDHKMGHDFVMECYTTEVKGKKSRQSYNSPEGHENKIVQSYRVTGMTDLEASVKDNILACQWVQDPVISMVIPNEYGPLIIDINQNKRYLMLATGQVKDEQKMKHSKKVVGPNPVSLKIIASATLKTTELTVQVEDTNTTAATSNRTTTVTTSNTGTFAATSLNVTISSSEAELVESSEHTYSADISTIGSSQTEQLSNEQNSTGGDLTQEPTTEEQLPEEHSKEQSSTKSAEEVDLATTEVNLTSEIGLNFEDTDHHTKNAQLLMKHNGRREMPMWTYGAFAAVAIVVIPSIVIIIAARGFLKKSEPKSRSNTISSPDLQVHGSKEVKSRPSTGAVKRVTSTSTSRTSFNEQRLLPVLSSASQKSRANKSLSSVTTIPSGWPEKQSRILDGQPSKE